MTREDAIKMLVNATYSDEWQGNEDLTTAHDMAIKALEQEGYYKDLAQSYEKTIAKLNEAVGSEYERSGRMRLKHKIFFYKGLLIEICETLASICRYLEYDSRKMGNPMRDHMRSHFNELKDYSRELKEEQLKKLGGAKRWKEHQWK